MLNKVYLASRQVGAMDRGSRLWDDSEIAGLGKVPISGLGPVFTPLLPSKLQKTIQSHYVATIVPANPCTLTSSRIAHLRLAV